ncbi:MarR family winged helix-turn-helix transcriptional regulator [Amnibacterium kyonggiense]|uniref:DNA-binding MarR family transcriptional regulator n=1 Tax=Amnibacterium kyonggiense TaxID=595671 RepID=A0A4R7FQA4_9MICO|nr:MarR family transcriptional regulator [Amnibacterium kyonggiense]TDS79913.1 DNA-binding MarR family transcriptional regulator [Amnibacterium kyonggiense]
MHASIGDASSKSDAEVLDALLTGSRALLGLVAQSMGDALDRVTLQQFRILTILTTADGRSGRDLAQDLGVASSTVSRAVDRLVSAGWVRRDRDAGDRRAVRLTASDEARELVAGVAARRRALLAEVLERVPEADRADLGRAFRVLAVATREPQPADLRLLGL